MAIRLEIKRDAAASKKIRRIAVEVRKEAKLAGKGWQVDVTKDERFQKAIAEWRSIQVPEGTADFMRELALEAIEKLVRRTPKDTGRASKSYYVTRNRPATARKPHADVLGRARAQVAKVKPTKRGALPRVWITNNTPYINLLEHGSSLQAPRGMMGVTFEELKPRRKRLR